MAHIAMVDEGDAEGDLARLYAALVDPDHGGVDEILKVHSLAPEGLRAHLAVYRSAMADTRGLPKVEREMVAVAVSGINGCHY